jgi:hypothetical protein
VDGIIGTRTQPIYTSTTGILTINSQGMVEMVSVALSGASNYSFNSSIPGFIIINGNIFNQGQGSILPALNQGESVMYTHPLPQYLFNAYQNLMNFILTPALAMPPVPLAAVVRPAVIIPVPDIILPATLFTGAHSVVNLAAPIVFNGVLAQAQLPVEDYFSGARSVALTAPPVNPAIFKAAIAQSQLPIPVSFAGSVAQAQLPAEASFKGTAAEVILRQAVNLRVFEGVVSETKIKVLFPGGQKIIPTYGLGVPLGVEKTLMEPKIKEKEDK